MEELASLVRQLVVSQHQLLLLLLKIVAFASCQHILLTNAPFSMKKKPSLKPMQPGFFLANYKENMIHSLTHTTLVGGIIPTLDMATLQPNNLSNPPITPLDKVICFSHHLPLDTIIP